MIGWLQGKLIDKSHLGKIVLDVRGVGYEIETSLQTFFQIEHEIQDVSLFIHTVVREDAFLLFGFATQDERLLFRLLIKVNGIGPKVALGILSRVTPQEFIQIIRDKNSISLTNLPGIGKKTAERLIIEMGDSIQNFHCTSPNVTMPSQAMGIYHQNEAIIALESLGYKKQEATNIIKKVDDGQKTCEQLIKQALQLLAKA